VGDERRITQLLAEIDQEQDSNRRITQVLAEIDQIQDTDRRITQVLAEVDQDATEERRVTQILLEVDYVEEDAPPPPPPPPPIPIPVVPCIVPPELMGRYQVILYDHDGTQLALFDDAGGFENLEYIKSVNGQGHHNYGNFRLRVLATRSSEFALDRFVQVRRKYPNGEWYTDFEGFHRRHEFLVDSADKEIYLSLGPDLKSMVKRRIIRPDAASAFFSRTDAFTDVMRELARFQLGSSALDGLRQFANFSVEADTNQGAAVTRNLRGVGVSDEIEILSELGADFDVDRIGPTLTFHVYYPRIGLDRRVGNVDGNVPTIFSLQRGNMVNPRIVTDRIAETTMAYVAGDGIGAAREIVERFSLYDAQFDSPWNRIEAFLEGSQNINTAALNAMGDAFLMENKEMFTFEFQGIPTEGTQYGRDWNVGDLVTGRYREIDYNMKVVEAHILLGSAGEEIRPTFLFIPEDLL